MARVYSSPARKWPRGPLGPGMRVLRMAADARADAIMDEIAVFAQERRDNETHTRGARRPKRARMTVFDEGGNELSSSSLDR